MYRAIATFKCLSVAALSFAALSFAAQQYDHEKSKPNLDTDNAVQFILDRFDEYPLVAIAEGHGLQELSNLYEAILRNPDFPKKVGVVVVEFGSGAHQPVIDRYVSGMHVSYQELSAVWRDLVGAGPRAITQSIPRFFAIVRDVNRRLPKSEQIRVLAGHPPFDFDREYTREEFFPVMIYRDEYFARIVVDEVLKQDRRALLIAGGFHLDRTPAPAPNLGPPTVMQIVEEQYPGSAYVLQTHDGFFAEDCNIAIEALFSDGNPPHAMNIVNTDLEALLTEPGCDPILPIITPADVRPGTDSGGDFRLSPGGGSPEFSGRDKLLSLPGGIKFDTYSGPRPKDQPHWADGYLFLGNRSDLTLSPIDPMLYLDVEYFEEQARRYSIMTGGRFELRWEDLLLPEPSSYADRFFRIRQRE